MSSVDFKKCHTNSGEGAAMLSHAMRHDGKNVEYSNPDLALELSVKNSVIVNDNNVGLDGFGELLTSREIYQELQQAVHDIDRKLPPKRVRADRVDMMSYTVAAPDGLSREDEDKFFKIVHDEIARESGGHEHVTPGFVHRDEIHQYIDPIIKEVKMSRAHLHAMGIPYVKGKGVNGKLFETRERMRRLNRAIDTRCRRELGIQFLTGERLQAKGRSVEDMKLVTQAGQDLSKTLEDLEKARRELERLTGEINQLEDDKRKLRREIKKQGLPEPTKIREQQR